MTLIRRASILFIVLLLAGLALAACGNDSDDGDATGGDGSSNDTPTDDSSTDDDGSAAGGNGGATLTIDGTAYTFDGFICAFGHDNTQSDIYSFSSNAFGEIDGTQVQFQVSAEDPQSEGRIEGDGVVSDITLDDIKNFDDPKVS